MAPVQTRQTGPTLSTRGQGVIEALVALPVFLVLICLTFQIFFIAIAKVQLQYAAFYAARAGSVHGGDIQVMEKTASRILAVSPGLSSFQPGALKVKTTGTARQKKSVPPTSEEPAPSGPLTVELTWEYPLILPLANRLLGRANGIGLLQPVSTIPLQASWTTEMQKRQEKGKSSGR